MTGVSPRDSDTELYIQILQIHHGANLTAEQLDKIRQIKFDSVGRCRRKLQEEGEYMPSPEVAKKRKLKSWIVEQTAPGTDANGITKRVEERVWYATCGGLKNQA